MAVYDNSTSVDSSGIINFLVISKKFYSLT